VSGHAIIIKAITNEVDVIDWPDDNETEYPLLSMAVDGQIEAVAFVLSPPGREPFEVTMWVNEEGKLLGLAHNEIATAIYTTLFQSFDRIVGDVIITGGPDDDGYTVGLDQDIAFEWAELLSNTFPEQRRTRDE
jgi:hypothetical protein